MAQNQKTTCLFDLIAKQSARAQKTESLVRMYRATGSLYAASAFQEDDDGCEIELPIYVADGEGIA